MKAILALLLLVLSVACFGVGTTAGPYRVDVVTEPAVIPVGKATLTVKVTDASGKPIAGLQIKGIAQMPGMPMGEREQMAVPGDQPGTYRIPASFAMAGGYEAKISISGPLGSATASVPLETGKSTAAGEAAGFPWSTLLWVVIGIAALAFVLYRMRKTGQHLDARPMLSRPVLIAIALFALVIFGSIYAVNHFRRPGAMTPIEAQVMDMNAPAPEGVVPVTLATAELRPFNPSVSYSGQVVGFVEQDVYPRVTGTIVWMPYYVGNSVRKGQVLARLDTTQILPLVNEKAAMVQSAQTGVGSAQADYQQALAAVSEAEAELGQREGLVQEAEANLSVAREARDAAQSQVVAAQSDVENARAMVSSAEADQRYWTEELKRAESLFAAGALSKDEYQKEKADAEKSAAALRQANQGVTTALAKVKAAQAQKRQADAGVTAAQKKVVQAQSELMAHHAHVRTTQAAANSAKQKIGQASANVGAARAGLQGATANASYAEIRAETDGVITQRLISPGVLVNPGQAILRVAQIQPIRVQANVSEADLSRIQVGEMVQIRHRDKNEKPVIARVSSVAPSLDASARTGIVEAVLPNRDKTFLPGQFVSADISTSAGGNALVIPRAALQTEAQASETSVLSTAQRTFVWVATPIQGQTGRFTVARVNVEVGDSSGASVAIKGGLAPGQQVVSSPATTLRSGQIVASSTPQPPSSVTNQTEEGGSVVQITEQGFEPASISVKAGQPARITFIRKTDNTCAKEVVFPALKITKPLPLNERVTIEIPSQMEGELNYACGMDMLHGKVVVK